VAKQTLQPIGLNRSIETIPPGLEAGARLKLLAKIMRVVKALADCLHGRRQRATVESFVPRQSPDRESRLEFERFIHW